MKICLIQGGMSAEAEVSRSTGASFANALETLGFDFEILEASSDLPYQLYLKKPDLVFNALHGKYGEDGTVQGICEYLKIPYTGSGILASALCMDKIRSKRVARDCGIPTADFQVLHIDQGMSVADIKMDLPLVVKPSREGSSNGVSLCHSFAELEAGVKLAQKYDYKLLIEKKIEGKELTVPILSGRTLTPIEIRPKHGFYDYLNKYTKGNTEYLLPPEVSAEVIRDIQNYALRIFQEFEMRSYARIDFLLNQENKAFFMEANTLPGCTETSLLPKAAKHDGIAFEQLVLQLIDSAALDYAGLS